MGNDTINSVTENCTGCLRCALACSELYTGSVNPVKAYIRVERAPDVYTIRFEPDCNECGICVDSCFYGALEKGRREEGK